MYKDDDRKRLTGHHFLANYQDENRSIHGWKILLDRGLDVFNRYEMRDAFTLANRVQKCRPCKAFEVTYLRVEES